MTCTQKQAVNSSHLGTDVIHPYVESFKTRNRIPTIHKSLWIDCQIYLISFYD